MARNQAQDAQYLYDERSSCYDDSWHPRFARHVVELISPQLGERVLDLACGTGLVSLLASQAVGPTGKVIGIDISGGMLAEARRKQLEQGLQNVQFCQHSITDLDTLDAVKSQSFDVIICASALVLLPNPQEALKQWTSLLNPRGRLITDVTHPQSQLAYITLERVGKALDRPVPSYRLPFQAPASLRGIMENADLQAVKVKLLSQMDAKEGRQDLAAYVCEPSKAVVEKVYSARDGKKVFDSIIGSKFAEALAGDDIRARLRELFVQEWEKLADADDEIREIDGVFVGIGRRLHRAE